MTDYAVILVNNGGIGIQHLRVIAKLFQYELQLSLIQELQSLGYGQKYDVNILWGLLVTLQPITYFRNVLCNKHVS